MKNNILMSLALCGLITAPNIQSASPWDQAKQSAQANWDKTKASAQSGYNKLSATAKKIQDEAKENWDSLSSNIKNALNLKDSSKTAWKNPMKDPHALAYLIEELTRPGYKGIREAQEGYIDQRFPQLTMAEKQTLLDIVIEAERKLKILADPTQDKELFNELIAFLSTDPQHKGNKELQKAFLLGRFNLDEKSVRNILDVIASKEHAQAAR